MQEHVRQQFLNSSIEQLEKIVEEYGPNRSEGLFCLMLLEKKRHDEIEGQLKELNKPNKVMKWTLGLTALAALFDGISAVPILQVWVQGWFLHR